VSTGEQRDDDLLERLIEPNQDVRRLGAQPIGFLVSVQRNAKDISLGARERPHLRSRGRS